MYSRDFWKRRDKCTRFSFLKKKKGKRKRDKGRKGVALHEDAHEANGCMRKRYARTRRRWSHDRKRWESAHFLNTMPLECVFRRVSLTLWRKGRVSVQPRVLPSRGEWVFLSWGGRTRSKVYSQKVKLPKVNVIRGMYGKGRGTEGRDIIEA